MKKLVSLLVAVALLLMPQQLEAKRTFPCAWDGIEEIFAWEYYSTPQILRATVYCEGQITCTGDKVRYGIIAARREWVGKTATLWKVNEDGTLGDIIGYFDILDTGAGIDRDHDGKGETIKKGLSIDVYCPGYNAAMQWVKDNGEYVYMQICESGDY